jgi:hypothetical protein
MAPRIRPARTNDLPALSALAKRTWADAFAAGVSPDDTQAELEAGRSENYFVSALREKTILVAEGLYGRFGFQTVGTTRFTIGVEEMEDLVMLLDKTR